MRPLPNLDLIPITLAARAEPVVESCESTPEYKRFISEEVTVLDAPEQVDFSTNLCDTTRKTKASFEEKVE